MAFDVTIFRDDNLALVALSGAVGLDDVVGAYDAMLAHGEFQPGMHALWDARDGRLQYTPEGLQAVVNHVGTRQRERGRGYRVALVIDPDGQQIEALMFKALATVLPFKVRVYSELESARQWLLGGTGC